MKCPKCQKNIPDNAKNCPYCRKEFVDRTGSYDFSAQETGRFATVDPSKDSYDFDLQYTLTFKDAGEIRQTIADMDLSIGKENQSDILSANKKPQVERYKPEHRQRSQEEMEEAAQRAALRRERRKNGGKTGGHRVSIERISRRDKEKAAALRAARARRPVSNKNNMRNRRLVFGSVVAVLVVALIIGTINLFAGMASGGDIKYPTIYTKNNQLFMHYGKKAQLISTNLVAAEAPATANEMNASKKKLTDPKVYRFENPNEKGLINISGDGQYTYFLENMDMNSGRGDLIYYQNGSPRTRTLVSISAFYKIVVAKDGKGVLFLRKTDDSGNHGELCYWTPSLDEPISLEQDICSGNFLFAQDGTKALYIKNFNPDVHTGDLCLRTFGKDASKESRQLDEKVAFVFGTTPKSDTYLYAKNYSTEKGTYDLYSLKEPGNPTVRAEKAFLAPVILEKSECIYAYSDYKDNFQTVSYLDMASGTGNVVADEVTRIERVRNDEGAIIYSKSYRETNKSDYYMAAATENASQKVANAVLNLKEATRHRCQFDISDDFSRAAYIGAYDEEEGKGALMTMSIVNGYVGSEKRIADDAYGCDVSSDGAVVRFASGFNMDLNTVKLMAYSNSNIVDLAEDVCAGAFTYDPAGQIMAYATDVKSAPINSGNIYSVTAKGKKRKIREGASSYGLMKDGRILLLIRDGEGENPGVKMYSCNEKGGNMILMDEGVSNLLFY